jgi:NAD(P)-dependent dehydrogenase (short-subunit alcohol dehydrogenase family)
VLLEGKVAIVTGGGRGIGRAISKQFVSAGARVVVAQRDAESGERTCREIAETGGTAIFVPTDVGERDSVEALVAETVRRFGAIHILVNNAAVLGENGHILDVSQETWERVLRVNLTGPFMCSQTVARVMARSGGGSIINISSTNGLMPQPRCCAYASSKGGLENLTRSMAVDLAPYNIRVNTIAQGPVLSRLPDGTPPRPAPMTLLNRTAAPSEIAAIALFLASDASSYITGERIAADGGALINGYQLYGQKRPEPPSAG